MNYTVALFQFPCSLSQLKTLGQKKMIKTNKQKKLIYFSKTSNTRLFFSIYSENWDSKIILMVIKVTYNYKISKLLSTIYTVCL